MSSRDSAGRVGQRRHGHGHYLLYGMVVVVSLFLLMTYYTHSLLTSDHEENVSLGSNEFVVNDHRPLSAMQKVEAKLRSQWQAGRQFIVAEEEALLRAVHSLRRAKDGAESETDTLSPHKHSDSHTQSLTPPAHSETQREREPRIEAQDKAYIALTASATALSESEREKERLRAEKQMRHRARVHSPQCAHSSLLTYWRDFTAEDLKLVSPFYDPSQPEQYVTFEPDEGGWNNIRMQMELVLVFALSTGRTLVLPPPQPMYLLNAGNASQRSHSFADFFPLKHIRQRLRVISMEDFLRREALAGNTYVFPQMSASLEDEVVSRRNLLQRLAETETPQQSPQRVPLGPPQGRVVFDMSLRREKLALWEFLRNVSACPLWHSMTQFLAIPPSRSIDLNASLAAHAQRLTHSESASDRESFSHNAAVPDGLTDTQRSEISSRLTVHAAGRETQFYDAAWQRQRFVHFVSKGALDLRLLEHFYTFLFFADESKARAYKRFVRDAVRYNDEVVCRAARIVQQLLRDGGGSYVSFHIRRGEFQYKVVKLSAEKILDNVQSVLPQNSIAYVASDEKNASFFAEFEKRFRKVYYLRDFANTPALRDVNPNLLGLIEQLVCAHGSHFVGTWFSTFSGYITRMRGYLGYESSTVFFGDKEHRDRYQKPEAPKFPFYMREWETAWEHIDEDDL